MFDSFTDFFSKLLKIALRKFSVSEDDQNAEDATDNEQHDSLPEDPSLSRQNKKPRPSWGGFEFQEIANKALRMKKKLESDSKNSEDIIDTKNIPTQECSQQASEKNGASTSKRQDSDSSVWSDNLPVITISKTESKENIIDENKHQSSFTRSRETKFHPKIKCVLRKQTTQIDDDVISYFEDDLEKNSMESIPISDLSDDRQQSPDLIENLEFLAENYRNDDKSSSDETEQQNGSVETVLNLDFDERESK